jgi:hypothetical protein
MEIFHTVYKTTNLVNKQFYIGYHKTTNLSDDYLGSGTRIMNSIQKYGKENFKREILFIFESMEEAFSKEEEVIEIYRNKDPLCMNIRRGGIGYEPSDLSKQRLSKALTGRVLSESQKSALARLAQSNVGRKRSEATKLKLSSIHKGKTISEEHKQAISRANKGRKREFSEEHKQNISASAKKRPPRKHSEETKLKMSLTKRRIAA